MKSDQALKVMQLPERDQGGQDLLVWKVKKRRANRPKK